MNRKAGLLRLLVALLVLSIVWLAILPTLGRIDRVRARIESQERRGIHPDAMFYSELGPLKGVHIVRSGGGWKAHEFHLGR